MATKVNYIHVDTKIIEKQVRQLDVNYCSIQGCVLFGLEECARRIGNPTKIKIDITTSVK